MNHHPIGTSQSHRRPARKGLALVVTVTMLALMVILVAALMNTTGDGYKEAVMVSGKDRARQTAQNVVHVALAQLREATRQSFANGDPRPWTSQPGAVRVHNMDGSLDTLYKLYSSNTMTASSLDAVAADLPDDWNEKPDDFVDLNEPRPLENSGLRFPIVDPRAWTENPMTAVEGFEYQEQKGALGPRGRDANAQRLPMPVRWIYSLQDGTMGNLDEEGVFRGPGGVVATAANPIVSRFAFWVDDETSKININTAAEGAYWDTPRADTAQERALAKTVPSRLEYMRHAGHPSGVCLSSVLLPNRRIAPLEFPVISHPLMRPMGAQDARGLWRMGRLSVAEKSEGTALGGMTEANWQTMWSLTPRESIRQARYADVDELLFDHVNPARFPGMWGNSDTPEKGQRRRSKFFQDNPQSVVQLSRSHFFMTPRSAGPEVTLFGTPRVAMWPMHGQTLQNGDTLGSPDTSRDTIYNHKVALAATVKKKPYFVQRSEPGNGVMDYRGHMGGANKALFDYLQRLTDRPFPGFQRGVQNDVTFAGKYGEDRDAILLGMMDYVRSANFAEHQLTGVMQFSVLCPGLEHKGFGQIAPLQLSPLIKPAASSNHIQALGRVLTVSEVALIITCRAEVDKDGKIRGEPSPSGSETLLKPGDREFDVGFLVETFLPGHGWTDYRPYVNIALAGGVPGGALNVDHRKAALPVYMLNGVPLERVSNETAIESTELPPTSWHGAGGSLGVRGLPFGVLQFKPIVIEAPKDGEEISLSLHLAANDGNQLKVALYDAPGSTDSQDLVQVIPVQLPDIHAEAKIPLPTLAKDVGAPALESRMLLSAEAGKPFLSATDIVQALAPVHGDYRVSAAQRWVESRNGSVATPLFVPHPQWGRQRLAHNLRDQILPVETARHEGYIQGLNYAAASRPDMPDSLFGTPTMTAGAADAPPPANGVSSLVEAMRLDQGIRHSASPQDTGDFDNGIAGAPDGPYTNRPDDGHWAAAKEGKLPYFDNVSQVGIKVPPVSLAAFSPQRLLPSPVMFGSLPTGVRAQVPWQTLLFRPQPQHYGAQGVPDHVLLDLFWSPVLEPEPLSVNLETEGKINLNHQILPFRHITRATALHAAMKAEAMMAIPDSAASTYKSGGSPADRFRHNLDAKQTVNLWKKEVFDLGDVFLTASQICTQYLVPEGLSDAAHEVSRSDMESYWAQHRLTGDNSKERPYAHLYSRLTTRSNTYRVHFVSQSLIKNRRSPAGKFNGSLDRVSGTFSGQAVLSRKLDLENPQLPDYQAAGNAKSLDQFYTWAIGPVETE